MQGLRPRTRSSPAFAHAVEREPQVVHVEERDLDAQQFLPRKESPAKVEGCEWCRDPA